MRIPALLFLSLASCAATSEVRRLPRAANQAVAQDPAPRPVLQAQLGVVDWDEDELTFTEASEMDPNLAVSTDLSSMPVIGAFGQWPLWPQRHVDLGLEGGLLASWGNDKDSFSMGGGGPFLAIKSRMILLDFSFGAYASTLVKDRLRLYAGAGPLVMLGWLSTESEDEDDLLDETEFDVSLGVYARAGVEVRVGRNEFLGVGLRALTTEQEYSNAGDVELEGLELFIGYTVGL